MFCGCALSFGEEPNTRTCPVCLGHPGTLPVTNAEAVHYGLMIGLALGCDIAPRSIFHRKNYFYPDLPKGYQISQYDIPLARAGRLGDVRVHRVHLEEDAAKLVHAGSSGRIHGSEASTVDFNRGGTPLVEIVTEPDLHSAADAGSSLRSKEEAHDYRYFPEPDLVPLAPTDEMLGRAREAIPELPAERAERFVRDLALTSDQARMLAFRGELGDYFEVALKGDGRAKPATLANWVTGELVARVGDADPAQSKIEPRALARLVELVSARTVSQSAAK